VKKRNRQITGREEAWVGAESGRNSRGGWSEGGKSEVLQGKTDKIWKKPCNVREFLIE
jgi:hypothetical protein